VAETRDTYAYFWVTGFDCSIAEITQQMGIEPTRAWNKGDPGTYKRQMAFSGWDLYSPSPRGDKFIHEQLEALLPVLEERAAAVHSIAAKYDAGINCVGYFENYSPGFHLSKETVSRVAALGLSVDFDLYCSDDTSESAS
jgi:hypothetical protein